MIMGRTHFSDQLRKVIILIKGIGYNSNVMRQSPCLVIYPITVYSVAAHFYCIGGSGVRLDDDPVLKLFILVVSDRNFFVC